MDETITNINLRRIFYSKTKIMIMVVKSILKPEGTISTKNHFHSNQETL